MAFEKGSRMVMALMVMQWGWMMAVKWVLQDYQKD